MEEINSRFEIVRLAIGLADYETIDIQTEKLRAIGLDENLHEILSLLENKNFRQALYQMRAYAASLEDSFFDESSPRSEKPSTPPPPQTPPPESPQAPEPSKSLFDEPVAHSSEERTLSLDDMLEMTQQNDQGIRDYQEPPQDIGSKKEEIALEEDESDDPLYHLKKKQSEKLADAPKEEEESRETVPTEENAVIGDESQKEIPGDDVEESDASSDDKVSAGETLDSPEEDIFGIEKEDESVEEKKEEEAVETEGSDEPTDKQDDSEGEKRAEAEAEEAVSDSVEQTEEPVKRYVTIPENERARHYSPISYIDQKFRNMMHQFPQVEQSEEGIVSEVTGLLEKIAHSGYSEADIAEAIRAYQVYKNEGKKAEAAQILLLAAATESQFAQFMLARELFQGDVLDQDHAEAFTQINRLAEYDYPEAICDLAQFYEYGIGIDKDKKKALLLYEEAMEMGIKRAEKHFERLSKGWGMLGSLFS